MEIECFKCKKLIKENDAIMKQAGIWQGLSSTPTENMITYWCKECYKEDLEASS